MADPDKLRLLCKEDIQDGPDSQIFTFTMAHLYTLGIMSYSAVYSTEITQLWMKLHIYGYPDPLRLV